MFWDKKENKEKKDNTNEQISELKKEIDFLKAVMIQKSSMGNQGVQTDSQQTSNRQLIDNLGTTFGRKEESLGTTNKKDPQAIEVINIMNEFQANIKRKFKSLTDQQFYVFCLIYSLEEQLGAVSYRDIAMKANLTESVIRDHVRHLFSKGIPIEKERKNNKLVLLKVAPELKGLVTLDALAKIHDSYADKRAVADSNNSEALKVVKEF